MFSISSHFLKSKKKITILSLAMASFGLVGCQTQKTNSSINNDNILGNYDTKSLKFSDLTPGERNEIVAAQKKVYETAQSILEKYYLDAWFSDYQSKNKIASLDEAKKDYFSKNTSVSDEEIKKFIKQNAANPQMQQIPEKEREGLVRQYLARVEQSKAEQNILQKAEVEGKINLTSFEKPKEPVVTFSVGGYKYDSTIKNPKITIVEFADYECPYCVQASAELEKVLAEYKGKVQFVFRDFPLTEKHPQAIPAAIAAKCASEQGKYWEMHKLLFNRSPMSPLSNGMYTKFAKQINLNMESFEKCQADKNQTTSKSIFSDMEEGTRVGVNGTPYIFINGEKYDGYLSAESLKKEIDARLAAK